MWKLFKVDLYNKLSSNHTSKDRLSDDLFDSIDKCYKRHIDVSSGGGRLTPSPREKTIREALRVLSRQNWSSRTPRSIKFNTQLALYIYSYWTLRVIHGPVGNTIVLFPGIFKPVEMGPNYSSNALDFIDNLTTSLTAHKATMSGITINHFPPAVIPWSGASLTSFDEVLSIGSLLSKMISSLSSNLDAKIAAGYLNPEDKNVIISSFSSNMSTMLQPMLDINQSIPNIGSSSPI